MGMGISLLEVPGERDPGLAKGFKPASQGYAVQVSSKPVDIQGCFQNRGTPKGWFIMENPIEMDGWWFQIFFMFTPNIGEMIQFDEHIFQMGWFNHQLV